MVSFGGVVHSNDESIGITKNENLNNNAQSSSITMSSFNGIREEEKAPTIANESSQH